MNILKVLIPKGDMPENCGKCKLCRHYEYRLWCPALSRDCFNADGEWTNMARERLPDCPLEEVENGK